MLAGPQGHNDSTDSAPNIHRADNKGCNGTKLSKQILRHMTKQRFFSERNILIFSIFIAGLCSIIYELLISTTSAYFLGNSVKQFSLTIGVYMAAMGLGSFLSKFVTARLLLVFIAVELALGLAGGLSVPILYYSFEQLSRTAYSGLMIALTTVIGILTGFEVPLLIRVMKQYYPLKENLANVLSVDYLGALIATLIFPFLMLPFFGIFRTSLLFGLLNLSLGFAILLFFSRHLDKTSKRVVQASLVVIPAAFTALLVFAGPILERWDNQAFTHRIIHSQQTPYQHLVLTRNRDDIRLYINRIIQFSSIDEYRYHESLALLPLQLTPYTRNVLVLGGGEGLLVRELLKEPDIEKIVVVDLDQAVFDLATQNPYLRKLNEESLLSPKVSLVTADASVFLQQDQQLYDLIIADLPDPASEEVARLYSTFFYKLVQNRLTPNGLFATQASSPFHTNVAFWCIFETLSSSGFTQVLPYHTYVPSFGDWGFMMASNRKISPIDWQARHETRFLDSIQVARMFEFEKDIRHPGEVLPNRLDRPVLLEYYLRDWVRWSKEKIK